MPVYTVNLLQALKKCLIMTSSKHNISATNEGNVIDITYVGELEICTVLRYGCATDSVWPGPFVIVLYLALNEKLWTPLVYMIHISMT